MTGDWEFGNLRTRSALRWQIATLVVLVVVVVALVVAEPVGGLLAAGGLVLVALAVGGLTRISQSLRPEAMTLRTRGWWGLGGATVDLRGGTSVIGPHASRAAWIVFPDGGGSVQVPLVATGLYGTAGVSIDHLRAVAEVVGAQSKTDPAVLDLLREQIGWLESGGTVEESPIARIAKRQSPHVG